MNANRKSPKKVVRVVFASAYRRLDNKVNREKKQSNPSNENITTSRNIAIWPARSARPRLVVGLFIRGGGKPS